MPGTCFFQSLAARVKTLFAAGANPYFKPRKNIVFLSIAGMQLALSLHMDNEKRGSRWEVKTLFLPGEISCTGLQQSAVPHCC
jgi:hypothetical protein